ncbi:MAG TPA: hydroxysqualene dehydroxylase HpnE [Acetobacteraceae bacterium]|jgi:squalene-associated FAD-dependent desaturase
MHVHVIGAGLAGLSAAVTLSEAGQTVTVVEAGPAAGGRCRSYFDRELGLRIDNGNHLLLSGNRSAFAYLDTIGARATLAIPPEPMFPFLDLSNGLRWTLRPNLGRIPWWVLLRQRRAPGTHATDHLALLRLRRITNDATVAASLRKDEFYRRLIQPIAVAALNTPPDVALVRLLGAVMRETLLLGGGACIPAVPHEGLSESLVDPAIAWLQARGCPVITGRRVTALRTEAGRVRELATTDGPMPVEAVVLAAPPWVVTDLLSDQNCPTEFQAILNIHFRVAADRGPTGFIGLVGGTAEWVFVKREHVSVTISAANRMVDQEAETIARAVWPEVRAALDLEGRMPAWRVVKERRATVAATAEQERLRPGPRTGLANLVLAGDWTDTGLPGTIEGAIRSGRTAAEVLLAA